MRVYLFVTLTPDHAGVLERFPELATEFFSTRKELRVDARDGRQKSVRGAVSTVRRQRCRMRRFKPWVSII